MSQPLPAIVPAIFLGDHPALDFVNTLASPDGIAAEWIGDGEALLGWMRTAAMIGAADERAIRSAFGAGDLNQAAGDARSLRDWFRGVALHPQGKDAARRINAILRGDEQVRLLQPDADPVWRTQRLWREPRSLLGPIAESMGKLLTEEDMSLVRSCGGDDCTIVFLDRTKSHKRRWCSMAACGNRAKVAAFRARRS